MGVDIVKSKYDSGIYFVKDQEWKIALKRIADVLSSPELARRVLREICILRRLRHPFIVRLRDAFLAPSSTGQYKMVDGQLVSTSLDCYLSMELGQDGDLFNLRGQISGEEVRLLMWQLLHALKYLHMANVWHRDVKSSNVLLMREDSHRIVKLADFGSSRSATQGGYHFAEQGAPEPKSGRLRMPVSRLVIQEQQAQHKRGEIVSGEDLMDVSTESSDQTQPGDLMVQLGQEASAGGGVGFCSPLTRVVATPCYRAPEVVMSRGGYDSSIDMWSLGCIFGELLQRTPRVGSASTPHLKVAPLFAIHAGVLKTPGVGERYCEGAAPGDATTRSELQALFDVIGTPSWAAAEEVRSPAWRSYLQRLPGRAPTLVRRFAFAGEVAVHLLSRLLAFAPDRRCSAEEALQHEYFRGIESDYPEEGPPAPVAAANAGSMAGSSKSEEPDIKVLKSQVDAAWQYKEAAKKAGLGDLDEAGADSGELVSASGDPADLSHAVELGEMNDFAAPHKAAAALALLESEMVGSGSAAEQISCLRLLLEKECQAQANLGAQRLRTQDLQRTEKRRWPSPKRTSPLAVWADPSARKDSLRQGLLDESQAPDAARFGQERLSNVADTWNAKLDTAAHLKPGRHEEWVKLPPKTEDAGPRWGVSMTPPGNTGLDPKLQEIIRSQQLR